MTESNEYLTQEEIESLSIEEFSFYLAHGCLPNNEIDPEDEVDTDEDIEKSERIYDL